MKLPPASATVCTLVGGSLKADGGALFVKLLKTPAGYIDEKDKVKVTLTGVTTKFTGKEEDNADGQNAPYGIYIDDQRSVEKNLEVSGDTSVSDTTFVKFNKAS